MPRYPCNTTFTRLPPIVTVVTALDPFLLPTKQQQKKRGYTNCSSQQRTDYCIIRKGNRVITNNTIPKKRTNKKKIITRPV